MQVMVPYVDLRVCCPTTSRFTLENKAGECIDILKCDHIKNQLSSPGVTQEYKIYVNSLRCQGPAAFSVYCGPPPVTSPAPPPNPPPTPAPGNGDECVATAALPDPTTDCWGNATAIDQYPWLALIEYKKDSKIKLLCGGVLISGRYVLTAGHCVIGSVLNSGDPSNVRLGEYDTANSGPDCVEVEGGEPGTLDCTVDPVIIPIERVIPHPDYNPRNSLKWNDIAMLRLKHIAPYTDTGLPCITPDGKPGDCKTLETCIPLHKLVKNGVLLQVETLNLLRDSYCGFEEVTNKPKVCCPCVTLANKTEAGQCVNVFDCDHIRTRLATPPVPQQYKDYVNSLRCEGTAFFSVCCGPPPDFDPTTPINMALPVTTTPSENGDTASCAMSAQPPDPASGCCGCGGPSPKIFGGTDAGIDQYPWLALIEYEKEHQIKLMCGGALISGRYVLTAAHCVEGPAMNKTIPKNVRLGEYDTANEKDCVEPDGGDEGEKDCTLDPVIIPIEHIIAHPEYNPYSLNKRNDIALLRLASIPEYTEFVRPICLPTVGTGSFQGTHLYAAGWGAVSTKNSHSNVKQHMCAGGEAGKDACKGDSGGPLMHYHQINDTKSHFEMTGIVSFGLVWCGTENVPGVYTKVHLSEYKLLRTSHIIYCFVNLENQCRTLQGGAGTCTLLDKCQPLKDIEKKPRKTDADLLFLRQSSCGLSHNFKPKFPNPKPPVTSTRGDDVSDAEREYAESANCPSTLQAPAPETGCCGVETLGDFIRPICLPSRDVTVKPPEFLRFFAAGWGSNGTLFSDVKQHVDLPYVPLNICQIPIKNRLNENQICAGGEAGKDSCKGDSGGPLMIENGETFELVGVVSYGHLRCGTKDFPGVYTHVYKYLDWIKREMI
ncbi:hypothetical protein MSG28_012622 [Choristoneura fumiferana]|uniref:Uncharacterized protein n=1 Tax=Choristoneura fumiferana TaxID=7141 RepID=A0ACC0JHE8_CHOFU|nr:hypothetical protein MSG28_012622 [Choristoneura fumiferana]